MIEKNLFERPNGATISGSRILVIDSDPNICKLIKRGLGRAGVQVTQARNSDEGLQAYHLQRPDLVIIDVTQPDSGGWDACQRIREISLVPILLLIGHNPVPDIRRGIECDVNDFIRKPFSLKTLLMQTRDLLKQFGLTGSGLKLVL